MTHTTLSARTRRLTLGVVIAAAACLCGAAGLAAQTPSGYLGKRHVAALGFDYVVWNVLGGEYTARPGFVVDYRYVFARRASVGASARFAGWDYRSRAASSVQLGAEVELHSPFNRSSSRIAPLGLFYTAGLGYHAVNFQQEEGRGSVDGPAAGRPAPFAGGAPFVQLGWGYRYVIADKFVIAPQVRFLLGRTTGFGRDGRDYVPTSEVVQPGVRMGMMF